MVMKKILFIAPDYYGFNTVIYNGLANYNDSEVTNVVSAYTRRYQYKNLGERIKNFFFKILLKRNLKDEIQN